MIKLVPVSGTCFQIGALNLTAFIFLVIEFIYKNKNGYAAFARDRGMKKDASRAAISAPSPVIII